MTWPDVDISLNLDEAELLLNSLVVAIEQFDSFHNRDDDHWLKISKLIDKIESFTLGRIYCCADCQEVYSRDFTEHDFKDDPICTACAEHRYEQSQK